MNGWANKPHIIQATNKISLIAHCKLQWPRPTTKISRWLCWLPVRRFARQSECLRCANRHVSQRPKDRLPEWFCNGNAKTKPITQGLLHCELGSCVNGTYPPSQISSKANMIMSKLSNTARFSTFFFRIKLIESYRQFSTDNRINSFSCMLPMT